MNTRVFLQKSTAGFLRLTGLQYWPVRIRSGLAAGGRWTLFPWSSYWRGTQEPAMHDALASLGDITGWSCWDLGAHYGIYAIGLGRKVGPTGQVACFEPNPVSYARLKRHRRMNRLDWVKPFQAAVSDTTATAMLYTYGDLETTTTHLRYEGETTTTAAQPMEVSTLALDDLAASGQIRLPHLIKVDVEGHGHHALAGAIKSIRTSLPVIVMGFHDSHERDGTHQLLDPLGYKWRPVEADQAADGLGDFVLVPPGR